jgi:hypothetical protein
MSDVTFEIRLSQQTPEEVIQELKGLVVDSSATVLPEEELPGGLAETPGAVDLASSSRGQIRLIPAVEHATGKWSIVPSLSILLLVAESGYYVAGSLEQTGRFLDKLKPYIQEATVGDSLMTFEELQKGIKSAGD